MNLIIYIIIGLVVILVVRVVIKCLTINRALKHQRKMFEFFDEDFDDFFRRK